MLRFSVTFRLSFGKRKENDTDQEVIVKEHSRTPAQVPSKQSSEGRTTENLFRRYSERLIDRTRKEGRTSCAGNYGTAMRSFMQFLGREDIPVTQINGALIKRYELWLRDNGVSRNTSSCYMRSLRSLYNKVSHATHTRNRNPFDDVFTGNEKTVKRAVGEDAISDIAALALPSGTRLCLSRNLFLFSFYAMGMPFVDLAHLQKRQIEDGVLTYHRRKTGTKVQVRVEPCMQDIIDRYDTSSSPYVFPILRAGATMAETARRYRSALSYHNRLLKRIGCMAGLARPLTTYVARHSWASAAYKDGVNINVIAQALGHSSPETTRIYVRELDGSQVFRANKNVLNGVKKQPLCKRRNLSRKRFEISRLLDCYLEKRRIQSIKIT
jgi:integrase/recombinase XerD